MNAPDPLRRAPLVTSRAVRLLSLALAAALGACSAPSITVDLKMTGDPLADIAKLKLTVSGPDFNPLTAEASRSASDLVVPEIPLGKERVIRVDGFDAAGKLRATGRSAPFEVTDESPERVTVPFSGCIDGDNDGVKNCEGDCNDRDARVKPSQTKYFTEASDNSFDYNCDDIAQRELTAVASCTFNRGNCTGDGWKGQLPACGESHDYVTCVRGGSGGVKCTEQTTKKRVACR